MAVAPTPAEPDHVGLLGGPWRLGQSPISGRALFHVSPVSRPVVRPHKLFFKEHPPHQLRRNPKFLSDRRVELIFERVRRKIEPSAPSRKDAWFAFPCEKCADWFRRDCRPDGVMYRLDVPADATVFCGDLVWRNVACNMRDGRWQTTDFSEYFPDEDFLPKTFEETVQRIAYAYWSAKPVPIADDQRPEALILHPEVAMIQCR